MLRPILFCIHFLRCVPRIFLLKILWTFCLNVIASFQLMLSVRTTFSTMRIGRKANRLL